MVDKRASLAWGALLTLPGSPRLGGPDQARLQEAGEGDGRGNPAAGPPARAHLPLLRRSLPACVKYIFSFIMSYLLLYFKLKFPVLRGTALNH